MVWIHHPPGYDPTHSPARVLRIALSARDQMHVAAHHGLPGSLPGVHADVEPENGRAWHGEKEVASRAKTWVSRDASARRRTSEGLKWLLWVHVWHALEGTPEGSLRAYRPGARRARPMLGSKAGLGEARPGQAARPGQSWWGEAGRGRAERGGARRGRIRHPGR